MDIRHRHALVGKIATLVHQRSGHVDDHHGEVGGCHRAAEEIVDMFPADLASARIALEELTEATAAVDAHRAEAMAERTREIWRELEAAYCTVAADYVRQLHPDAFPKPGSATED